MKGDSIDIEDLPAIKREGVKLTELDAPHLSRNELSVSKKPRYATSNRSRPCLRRKYRFAG